MPKLAILLLLSVPLAAQQADILREVNVLRLPGMDKAGVRKDVVYDGTRKFDLYRPPSSSSALPVVIFLNGVGVPALKEWGQYTSWPRLVAARGMAAISYETSGDDVRPQTEALLAWLRDHAGELKLDMKRVALWSCSANVRLGTELAATHDPADFRAHVFYYGIMSTPPKHREAPALVTRAGLDTLVINDSIDRWVAEAVALDAPVTLIAYPQGPHGFDIVDDTAQSRHIVGETLDFLAFHLENAPPPRKEPMTPAELQRLVRANGVPAALARLNEIRTSHPNAIVLRESSLNALGYAQLSEKKLDDAITILQLAVTLNPDSANAHDSLGDAYEAAGRTADAIAESERAIQLLDRVPAGRRELIRRSAEEKLKRLRK